MLFPRLESGMVLQVTLLGSSYLQPSLFDVLRNRYMQPLESENSMLRSGTAESSLYVVAMWRGKAGIIVGPADP